MRPSTRQGQSRVIQGGCAWHLVLAFLPSIAMFGLRWFVMKDHTYYPQPPFYVYFKGSLYSIIGNYLIPGGTTVGTR